MKKRRKHRHHPRPKSDRQMTEAERRFERDRQRQADLEARNKALLQDHQERDDLGLTTLMERQDTSRQMADDEELPWSFTVGRIAIVDGPRGLTPDQQKINDRIPVQVIKPTTGAWGIPEMHPKLINHIDGREPMKKVRQYLEPREVADLLEISYDTACRRLADQTIPNYEPVPGKRRVLVERFMAYLTGVGHYDDAHVDRIRLQIKQLLLGDDLAAAA